MDSHVPIDEENRKMNEYLFEIYLKSLENRILLCYSGFVIPTL
jgi:hypothetical protein